MCVNNLLKVYVTCRASVSSLGALYLSSCTQLKYFLQRQWGVISHRRNGSASPVGCVFVCPCVSVCDVGVLQLNT